MPANDFCAGCRLQFWVGTRVPWDGDEFHSQCLLDLLRGLLPGTTRAKLSAVRDRLVDGEPRLEDLRAALLLLIDEAMLR